MDNISQLLAWVGEHEAVLSGIAATIAILAVVLALSSRTLGMFRSRKKAGQSAEKANGRKIPQQIRYCRLANGTKLAWSTAGTGYPLIRSLGWATNLEMEWDSPVSSPFWQKLASRFQLIRYDGRGMGLSDRDVTDFSPETRLEDLEAIVDASGVEKFAIFGLSEGGSTAIKYAHKHPDRVSHLIIWGSFLVAPELGDIPQFAAVARLVSEHWGSESAAFHQAFTGMFLPEGNAAENKFFNDMQRTSATPETATAFMGGIGQTDVRDLAEEVKSPALVLHRKGDLAIPVKYGKEVAAQLPNARLVLLEGSNHWLVTEEEDMNYIISLIEEFVGDESAAR